jgi:hypothetical protein
MGFFHSPLLKREMHPNGNANRTISIMAMLVKDTFRTVCRTRLTVENVRNRKMPFNHIPTCHPLVLYNVLIMNMFKTPNKIGCTKYVITTKKAKPIGGIYIVKDSRELSN